MFLQIGSYRHQINEAGLAITQSAKETKAGVPYMYEPEWTISGKLRNHSGVSRDLDRKMAALEQAYSTRGDDIALLHNDGRRTHHAIRNSDTLGGIRTVLTAYPTTSGAEYGTYRSYQVQITASIPIRNSDRFRSWWFESTRPHLQKSLKTTADSDISPQPAVCFLEPIVRSIRSNRENPESSETRNAISHGIHPYPHRTAQPSHAICEWVRDLLAT